jgi:hypothetical protein
LRCSFVAASFCACVVRIQTPPESHVACGASGECPRERVCVEGPSVCRPAGVACVVGEGDRGPTGPIAAVTFFADGRGVGVGPNGTIAGYDGAAWHTQQLVGVGDLDDVWGVRADDVYASGAFGTLLHYDGQRWAPVRTSTSATQVRIDGNPGRRLLFAAVEGTNQLFLGELTTPFGNGIACPPASTPTCSASDARISEVFSGAVDYVELVNTGCCDLDLSGLQIVRRGSCDGAPVVTTLAAGAKLLPGRRFRVADDAGPLAGNERASPAVCDDPGGAGWVTLCNGTCDLVACSTVIDAAMKRSGGTEPVGAPSCLLTEPDAVDVASEPASGDSDNALVRRDYRGGGAHVVATDWAIAPASRE